MSDIDSPLATRQKRDRLARRPLSQLAAETPKATKKDKKIEEDDTFLYDESSSKSKEKRRSLKNSEQDHHSPVVRGFSTSSPLNNDTKNATSPQESMIEKPPTIRKSPRIKEKSESTLGTIHRPCRQYFKLLYIFCLFLVHFLSILVSFSVHFLSNFGPFLICIWLIFSPFLVYFLSIFCRISYLYLVHF